VADELDPILNGDVDRKEDARAEGDLPPQSAAAALHVLKSKLADFPNLSSYEQTPKLQKAQSLEEAHTTPELLNFIEKAKADGKNVEVDARILTRRQTKKTKRAKLTVQKMNFESLRAAYLAGDEFKEWDDVFASDASGVTPYVGQDNVPLVGGPFSKQLYLQDYVRMHQEAFYAWHHDPVAKRIIDTIRDFTLGKGAKVEVTSSDPRAVPAWKAFERVNKIDELDELMIQELAVYGEIMQWWLPDKMPYITYDLPTSQMPKPGLIPRVRLIDPSCIWEIVTYPEDIQRVLYYQWVSQTQYQMYTGKDKGGTVQGQKFIIQQIPADQVDHTKINAASNEKRGRSELYPILGYLKRLRDTVNYSIVSLQKTAAWAIDTSVEGSQEDIDEYVDSQRKLGTIPEAGSEFVHSAKVKREYRGNSGPGGGAHESAFEWSLSMACIGVGVPVSYMGTHLASGATRAGSMVATEPVAKKFDYFQTVFSRAKRRQVERVMEANGIEDYEVNVILPEIISADRSAKLKDLGFAEDRKWISPKRAATTAVKELDFEDYDYDSEQDEIDTLNPPDEGDLLTAPGRQQTASAKPKGPTAGGNGKAGAPAPAGPRSGTPTPPERTTRGGGVTGQERRAVKMRRGA
jgi:hypothetical protein